MAHLLPLSSIIVPPRQRREIDAEALDELKENISRDGLLHAIVLREDGRTLVAGERRFRAISALHLLSTPFSYDNEIVPPDMIPATIVNTDNDAIRQLEIELSENVLREDLPWQDKVQALSDLHKLRNAQTSDKQSFSDTAKEVAKKTGKDNAVPLSREVSRAMLTADFLQHPTVKSARNEQEAFNAAARIIRTEFVSAIPAQPSNHTFIQGDATKELKKIVRAKRSFSCFIVDPPYGVDASTFKNQTKTKHSYDDSVEHAMALNETFIDYCFHLGSADAHLWLFCDVDHFIRLRTYASEIGWRPFPTPIVWNSGTRGHVPNQKDAIRRNYELVLFARKGEKGLSQILDDVILNIAGGTIEHHAAAKPYKLYELFLRLSCIPGDNVLDPCCGSGTIFHAAAAAKVNGTGIELDEEYGKLAKLALIEASVKK